jgi:glycosyltransferase involved in cell wall biosynthesis
LKFLFINSLDARYGSTYRFRKLWSSVKATNLITTYVESNCKDIPEAVSVSQSDSPAGYLKATLKRIMLCLRLDYDVLVIQKFLPLTVPCMLVAKLGGKRIIVDWDDLDSSLQSGFFRKVATSLCENLGPLIADLITTHSSQIIKLALEKFAKKAIMVNQGADFELFDPSKFAKESLKKDEGHQGKLVLGFLCTLTHGGSQDLDIILVVFKEALKNNANLILKIIGGGPLESAVRSAISYLGINDNVVLTGLVPQIEVPRQLASCDLSLIYMRENKGNRARVSFKVLESLAMNKPVIGHIVGETEKLFGKYVDHVDRDLIAFKRRLLEITVTDLPIINAREEIIQDYSWQNISRQFQSIIENFSKSQY